LGWNVNGTEDLSVGRDRSEYTGDTWCENPFIGLPSKKVEMA